MRSFAVLFLSALIACSCASRTPHSRCTLTAPNARWLQTALDAWERTSTVTLGIDPQPLPPIVVFDDRCTWYLAADPPMIRGALRGKTDLTFAGRPVAARVRRHDGTVLLPNGKAVPAGIMAVAMPGRQGSGAFYVLALMDLWRSHPAASRDPYLEERLLSVTLHEMIHTRQLPLLRRKIDEIEEKWQLPAQFSDDVIENRFGDVPGFREAFEAERDLFYAAATSADPVERIRLAGQGLAMARKRRARFFSGHHAPYAELESLFLNMEGLAEWIRFKHHQLDSNRRRSDEEILEFLRGTENSWSQDEGLALYLLLDRLGGAWLDESLHDLASPFELLRRSIAE